MAESERIVLDAELRRVISKKAFRAQLPNGHAIVAFRPGAPNDGDVDADWQRGRRVRVAMSPFDMSKGRILDETGSYDHESTEFSEANV